MHGFFEGHLTQRITVGIPIPPQIWLCLHPPRYFLFEPYTIHSKATSVTNPRRNHIGASGTILSPTGVKDFFDSALWELSFWKLGEQTTQSKAPTREEWWSTIGASRNPGFLQRETQGSFKGVWGSFRVDIRRV